MDILISEEKGVRQLHFGSEWVQGAMRISRPYDLELEYTREMMLPLVLQDPRNGPRKALCIGLGVGAIPKFLHRHWPNSSITVVEIEPAVVLAAQAHFKLPPMTPNFQVEIGCGAAYLAKQERQFDLIVVDGFDAKAKVGPLNSLEFYQHARAALGNTGCMVVNILSRQKDTEPGKQRLRQAFDGQAVVLPPCGSGNVVALASGGAKFEHHLDTLKANAQALQAQTGLNLMNSVVKFHNALVSQSVA
ncbi:fused MFS/spermidine synthase [Limnobacter sp.]|uniref:fused MFS/spermidine synthase n=1 Tax=Limnobacter sp. TaxID=2003368 RepID=UPI0035135847